MTYEKFDISRMDRLDDESRFDELDPAVLWEALDLVNPAVIVEIGAGTGLYASLFAAMAPGAVVYAADLAPEMVQRMKDRRPEIVPLQSSESHVPLDDSSANAVVMLLVHHELADPAASYQDAARLLAPQGRVLIADVSPDSPRERPPRHIRASAEKIVAALEGAGFTDVRPHEVASGYSVVTGTRS